MVQASQKDLVISESKKTKSAFYLHCSDMQNSLHLAKYQCENGEICCICTIYKVQIKKIKWNIGRKGESFTQDMIDIT